MRTDEAWAQQAAWEQPPASPSGVMDYTPPDRRGWLVLEWCGVAALITGLAIAVLLSVV